MAPRTLRFFSAWCALSYTAAASAAEPTPGYPEPVIQWGVQKGETCDDIAKVTYGSAKHVGLLHRYNRITCGKGTPLPEGLTLVLPATVTSIPDARIKGAHPEVKARPSGGAWVTATAGMPLTSNAGVNTLDTGRADLEFVDRSRIFLAPRTLVVIYGTASRSRVSKAPPAAVELEAGEVKAALAALRGGSAAEVEVKGGGRVSAASRDTVVQRKGERTTVAVFDGKAAVRSAGRAVEVPTNHGTRFTPQTPPAPPRPLPPAPRWAADGGPAVMLAPGGEGILKAAWEPVAGAIGYRVEVARDADFNDLVAREEVPPEILSFRGERLPARAYHLRVRAIDKEEYLGIGAVRAAHLLGVTLEGGKPLGPQEIEASPYGTLRLNSSAALEMALDDGPFGPVAEQVDLKQRRPSALRLRERAARGAAPGEATTIAIRYVPVTAAIEATFAQGKAGGVLEVRVKLAGAEGVDVPGRIAPQVRAHLPGGARAFPLAAGEGGALAASIPLSGIALGAAPLRLDVIDDRGGVLGTAQAAAPPPDRPEPDAPAQAPREPRYPVLGAWAPMLSVSPAIDTLWLSPTPPDAVSAGAGLGRSEQGVSAQAQARVSGSIGPLGLDAAVRSGASGDPALGSGGWAGARVRVLRLGRSELELAPALRAGFPLAASGPAARLEPSLAAGGAIGRLSWLVNGGARVRLEDDGGASGVPSAHGFLLAGVTYDPAPWLRLHAAVDGHLLYDTPIVDEPVRGGISVGAEAGGPIFGGAAVRVGPPGEPGEGIIAGQLVVGVRDAGETAR